METDGIVGWDLGGAHVKAALLDGRGVLKQAIQVPCPLWKGIGYLETAVEHVTAALGPGAARHAVTMTGELVDLFRDRREGVARLVGVFTRKLSGSDCMVFAGEAGFVAAADAAWASEQVASANWLATASFVARELDSGYLVDVGSTTTDLVPFGGGEPLARGHNDRERLGFGELVYCGVARTPVIGMAARAPFDGVWIDLMAECFATAADVYRLTGELPEWADQMPAADGGEKGVRDSARRLARMLGCDLEPGSLEAWQRVARYIADRQLQRLGNALALAHSRGVVNDKAPLVGAGSGAFVAGQLAERFHVPYVPFASLVPHDDRTDPRWLPACAPAFATAALALAAAAPAK